MDRERLAERGASEQLESAIRNYETAFRMQTAVPELVDLSAETAATRRLYGLESPVRETVAYGQQCLLARRLVERGVRFIELTCLARPADPGQIGNPWDQHGGLKTGHAEMARQVDQPIAGLIQDLKQRGLFEETVIVWAGEFGRTPFAQGTDGRDHNPFGFSVWLGGGGIRGGTVLGATDELGYYAVEDISTVYDLWATVLHVLGVDHESLTYRFGGRDFRLTDVHGQVLEKILQGSG
jgi:membrane-anchored protein YejM (alkaline phosphatase superfamily)